MAGLIVGLFLLKLYLGGGDFPKDQGLEEPSRFWEGGLEGPERRPPSEGFPRVAVDIGE